MRPEVAALLQDDFDETSLGSKLKGGQFHNLHNFLTPEVRRQVYQDPLKPHWERVLRLWKYNELRYSDSDGEFAEAREFLGAVEKIHSFFLKEQEAA